MPCVLVTFDKEQIVVWRGNDYKPIEADPFFMDRDPFDNPDNDLFSGPEESKTLMMRAINMASILERVGSFKIRHRVVCLCVVHLTLPLSYQGDELKEMSF